MLLLAGQGRQVPFVARYIPGSQPSEGRKEWTKFLGYANPMFNMVEIQLGPTLPTINGSMHFLTTIGVITLLLQKQK